MDCQLQYTALLNCSFRDVCLCALLLFFCNKFLSHPSTSTIALDLITTQTKMPTINVIRYPCFVYIYKILPLHSWVSLSLQPHSFSLVLNNSINLGRNTYYYTFILVHDWSTSRGQFSIFGSYQFY